MTKTEMYYALLGRFESQVYFTAREALLWYGDYTENTENYPFNGYDMATVRDAWRLERKKNSMVVADPNSPLKVYTENLFKKLFKKVIKLSDRIPEDGERLIPDGRFVYSSIIGGEIEILVTKKPGGSMTEILPVEHRRSIEYIKKGSKRGFWSIGPVPGIVLAGEDNKTKEQDTPMESFKKSSKNKIKRLRINSKKKRHALENGDHGQWHIAVTRPAAGLFLMQDYTLDVAEANLDTLVGSDSVTALEEQKARLWDLSESLKAKDAEMDGKNAEIRAKDAELGLLKERLRLMENNSLDNDKFIPLK